MDATRTHRCPDCRTTFDLTQTQEHQLSDGRVVLCDDCAAEVRSEGEEPTTVAPRSVAFGGPGLRFVAARRAA